MTTNEKDYSDFIKHLSNVCSVCSVYAGFMFTAITLLVTLLPDPSSIMSQLTLFFLAVVFMLLLILVVWNALLLIYFCKNVPPRTKQIVIDFWLVILATILAPVALVLMFLALDLIYLALAIGVVWALMCIAGIIFLLKPFLNFYETRARILGRVEKKEKHRD